MLSVNLTALNLVKRMIEEKGAINVEVEKAPSGATIVDAGIGVKGGFVAGKYLTEVCLGGLAEARLGCAEFGELVLPTIEVYTDHPAVSLLASQFAGWRISVGKYFAMGSGPARALALKPKELYEKVKYQDSADKAVIVLETSEKPPSDAVEYIANECNVKPEDLYVLVAPTSSIAGSTQISGRVVEMGIHRLVELGFDPTKVLYGSGTAPIAPLHPKFAQAMGRTNDMLLYAGSTFFVVEYDDDEGLRKLVEKAPSCTSSAYGRPFYEIFKEANYDFYKIDPALFAPAKITVNNIKTGKSFSAGTVNLEILKKSIAP